MTEQNRLKKAAYQFRFPDGMREMLKERAITNGRSLNAELICLIEKGLGENFEPKSIAKPLQGIVPFADAREKAIKMAKYGLQHIVEVNPEDAIEIYEEMMTMFGWLPKIEGDE